MDDNDLITTVMGLVFDYVSERGDTEEARDAAQAAVEQGYDYALCDLEMQRMLDNPEADDV